MRENELHFLFLCLLIQLGPFFHLPLGPGKKKKPFQNAAEKFFRACVSCCCCCLCRRFCLAERVQGGLRRFVTSSSALKISCKSVSVHPAFLCVQGGLGEAATPREAAADSLCPPCTGGRGRVRLNRNAVCKMSCKSAQSTPLRASHVRTKATTPCLIPRSLGVKHPVIKDLSAFFFLSRYDTPSTVNPSLVSSTLYT